jgi:hypothetical protein
MADLTPTQVGTALKNLGNFRVITAQVIASEGEPDLISGALLLSMGLRESHLRNVENPAQTDKSVVQISSLYHAEWLKGQPGCAAGSFSVPASESNEWRIAPGKHTAFEPGYVPRYTPAMVYACDMLKDGVDAAPDGLTKELQIRFAISAFNAGLGGAKRGLRDGDVDMYTTGKDYSAWVIRHRSLVQRWLNDHPNWKPS